MLSAKFLNLIETHSEQITEQVLGQLLASKQTASIQRLPRSELATHCHQVLDHLGEWLTVTGEKEIAQSYEARGRARAAEGVPLSEAIYFLTLLKRKMLDYIREQAIAMTNLDFYAQDELRRRVGLFFDWAIYYLARGHESSRVTAVARGA